MPETVSLAYAPTDQSLHEITETITTEVTEGETTVTDTWERVSRVMVVCTDEGYTNSVTIVSQDLKRNETSVPSPVHKALEGIVLTYTLMKDGTLVSVTGYDQLPSKMAERFAATFASTMSNLLNVEALKLRDEQAYNRLYAGILGEEMTVDANVTMAESQDLPEEGNVTLYSVTKLTREGTGDDTVVEVTTTLNSDSTALASGIDGIEATDLNAKATEAELTSMIPDDLSSATVTGSDTTTIDLSGLLIGSRTVELTFTLTPMVEEGETATPKTVKQTRKFEAEVVEQMMTTPETPQT